jgi:hypothetical protein
VQSNIQTGYMNVHHQRVLAHARVRGDKNTGFVPAADPRRSWANFLRIVSPARGQSGVTWVPLGAVFLTEWETFNLACAYRGSQPRGGAGRPLYNCP